jgi:hypothetical protein
MIAITFATIGCSMTLSGSRTEGSARRVRTMLQLLVASLPAAAEGVVQLHQRHELVASCLGEAKFGFEQVAVGVQGIEIFASRCQTHYREPSTQLDRTVRSGPAAIAELGELVLSAFVVS